MIAAALMLRPDESGLEKCLNSIDPIADEIVAVITGEPSQRTKQLLSRFNVQFNTTVWREDYSYHRNQSFDMVSPEADWILRIDSDEELILLDKNQLINTLKTAPKEVDCCRCKMKDYRGNTVVMEFPQLHFFRAGTVQWRYRKHNTPIFAGEIMHLDSCVTHHYGYDLEPKAMEAKRQEAIRLIKLTMQDYPGEYPGDFYLSQIYAQDKPNEAIKHLVKYIAENEDSPGFLKAAYSSLNSLYEKLGETDKAMEILKRGLEKLPLDLDLNFLLCHQSVRDNDYQSMVKGAERYIQAWNIYKKHVDFYDHFCYFHTDEHIRFVLHKLAIARLQEGISYVNHFFGFADTDNINDIMVKDLSILGIDWEWDVNYPIDAQNILKGV